MAGEFLPSGTATGNADAVRQGPISQFFYLVSDVLSGVDAQPRLEPGMSGGGLIGPSATFGIDVGVGPDGQVYARGRAGSEASGPAATPAAAAPVRAGIPPLLLLALAGAALWHFSK